jgi:CubicO group peptidase (beta-lactamase class C family)
MMQGILERNLELHSVMIVRHGQVAWENFRAPYGPQHPHAMYSVSKSVTSIAVGFAVEEGLLRTEDKVAGLIPELREYDRHENLEKLRVAHLLSMCAGKNVSVLADKAKGRWIRDFGRGKWDYAPGEGWHYCNENIYVLCAILRRVTGVGVVDYLMPRLFGPLGIPRPFWENDGGGVEAGGWGLFLRTEDLAKIVMCYLDGGKFQGRQVIPAGWVRASGSPQRDNGPAARSVAADGEQNVCGYGYCFWMNTIPGSFRMDGMFSQFALIFPQYDACVVTTGGELDAGGACRAIFRHIPALFGGGGEAPAADIPALPAYAPLPAREREPALEEQLNGRCIRFIPTAQPVGKALGLPLSMMPMMIFFMSADKAGGIDRVHLRFARRGLALSWSEGKERNTVLCGMDGAWRKCEITLGGVKFLLACSAMWEGGALHVRLRNLNSVAERLLTFRFKGRAVRMLPRSAPALERMTGGAAQAVRDSIPVEALGNLLAGAMDKITGLAEPEHFGLMR